MLVFKEVERFFRFNSEAAKQGEGKTFMAIKNYGKTSAQSFYVSYNRVSQEILSSHII